MCQAPHLILTEIYQVGTTLSPILQTRRNQQRSSPEGGGKLGGGGGLEPT